MRILSASEMREVDRITSKRFGIPSLALMENAGASVARYCFTKFQNVFPARVLVVCGKGNNGGDGLVAARHLLQQDILVDVILLGSYPQVQGDAKSNLDAFIATGVRPTYISTFAEWNEQALSIQSPDVVIDAILGTGMSKPLDGFLAHVIEDINVRFSSKFIISIDLPSGLNADSHEINGPSIRADATLTMTAPKVCLAMPPAADSVGKVHVIPIGSPDSLVEECATQNLFWLTESQCQFVTERRPANSNKGAFGHVLILAGSVGKTGAAVMSGRSALRMGSGLVTVATSSSAQPMVAASMPELMTYPLAETPEGTIDSKAFHVGFRDQVLAGKSVLALGPGISTHPETQNFARLVVSQCRLPIVIDADGLNAFVDHTDELDGRDRLLVLTPHPGELARLIRTTPQIIQADRKNFAREFAARHNVILVLKGFRTLVAHPDGRLYVCPTGNPGMAKGGSGDVLTGMIAGLLAQFPSIVPEEVVATAVFIHGLAGDYARDKYGEVSMIATDMIECLPEVLKDLAKGHGSSQRLSAV
jgi:NAD(P)H-hydrate epimerase